MLLQVLFQYMITHRWLVSLLCAIWREHFKLFLHTLTLSEFYLHIIVERGHSNIYHSHGQTPTPT